MFNILWCHCLVAQLCPTLYDPMNYSPPGSSVFPGKNDEWVDISSPGDHPNPGIKPASPDFRWILYY